MKVAPIEQFEKPRQRKGFVLTAVWWNPETGRIRFTKYEQIIKERLQPVERQPIGPAPRRGITAVEQGLLL